MTVPALTPRGFWTRVIVFGATLLLYAWLVHFMTRMHSLIGVALFSVLALFSLTGLIATVMRRPSRRPR